MTRYHLKPCAIILLRHTRRGKLCNGIAGTSHSFGLHYAVVATSFFSLCSAATYWRNVCCAKYAKSMADYYAWFYESDSVAASRRGQTGRFLFFIYEMNLNSLCGSKAYELMNRSTRCLNGSICP